VTCIEACLGVVDLLALLAALVGPGEVRDGNDKEAVDIMLIIDASETIEGSKTDLLELSAIPASALYQAVNAASNPNAPPAVIHAEFGALPLFCRYPMPRSKKAMSSVKNRKKKATVERSVQIRRIVVKMNHPIRYRPNELRNVASLTLTRLDSISKPPGVRMMAKESQKPP
jgi:hypothetical protein